MFKTYTPMQYLAIDIANHFGHDKMTYEDRISFVKKNLDELELISELAEEPLLYNKAVRALRDAQAGIPTGHTVGLDSVCSGMQIMSAVMGCRKGCSITGLVYENVRSDAYTSVTGAMNESMPIKVSRKDAKQAVMTSLYGSKAVPKDIFGEELLPLFYETMDRVAPGAMQLLALLQAAWNPEADINTWELPDGHMAVVPVTETIEKRICITELKYTPVVQLEVIKPQEHGISLIANVVHSLDAYVLRTLTRRCNYSINKVRGAITSLKGVPYSKESSDFLRTWESTGIVDMVMVTDISDSVIATYPVAMRKELLRMLEMCLEHKPFEIVTVHDQFGSSPVNCNQMRRVYADILGDLCESTVIDDLLNQLYGTTETVEKVDNVKELAEVIRQSNYGIC